MPVTKWRPSTAEIRAFIIRSLADSRHQPEQWTKKRWTELWNMTKGMIKCRTTLSLYLEALAEEGHIIKEAEGRRTYYSLLNTEYVERILAGISGGKVRRYGIVDLTKLNEEQFVRMIHSAIGMGLSVIMHDYILVGEQMLLGKDENKALEDLRLLLDSHYSNLRSVADYFSRVMARRIKDGSFQAGRLWEAKQAFSRELRTESIKVAKSQNVKLEEGTPKVAFGEVYIDAEGVRVTDLGFKRLYRLILDSRRKGAVPPALPIVETSAIGF